jgi:O-antigen/teichoic acid export membrane protein
MTDSVAPKDSTSAAARGEPLDAGGMNRLVSRNIFSSVGAKLLYLVTRFFLPPIILAYISLEEYGVWAMCFILIGYLGMSAFGVSNVYIRYVAQYHARGEEHRIGDLLSTGLTVVSLVGVVALALLWVGLPTLIEALSVSPELQTTAFVLIFGSAAIFVLELSWGAFAYVLTGLQRIVQQNQVWVGTFLLETLLVVVFLVAGFGVYGLLYAFAIRYLISISVNVLLCFRNLPGLRLSLRRFNRADLALFYRYGGIVQLSGFLGMFLRSIEKLIAGLFINVQATGLFDVAQKFPVMATSIPSSMNAVFLPATSYMHTQERRGELLELYLKGARYINLVTGFMMGFMAAFAAPLMVAWLGPNPEFALAPLILACFTLPFQLNVLTGPASNIYRGMGIPARELIYPLSQLALVIILVGGGFLLFGIDVVVITVAVALAMILSALIYMVYTNRFLALGQYRFMRDALLPGLWPYLTGFALYLLARPWVESVGDDRWGSVLLVLVAGIVYCVLQAAFLWLVQLDAGEKHFVAGKVRGLVGRLGGARRQRNRGHPNEH